MVSTLDGVRKLHLGCLLSLQAVQHGNKVRSTGASGVNPDSSRSHAILQIELRNSKKQRIGK
jgi:kinesin family protein 2/24